jgi:hypothetical protein
MLVGYNLKEELRYHIEAELDDVKAPQNYPWRLFAIETKERTRYALAATRRAAELMAPHGGKASPVLINDLVKVLGHGGARGFLRFFAQDWMVKKGIIFYGYGPAFF